MRVVSFKVLKNFWCSGYADAEEPLRQWHDKIKAIDSMTPSAIKAVFSTASFIGDNRIVFNIGGNKYRLVTHARLDFEILYVRFVGTHAQYDKINAKEV